MNALLADSPAVSSPEQAAQQTPGADTERSPAPVRACANCGSPLSPGQDWCLQCGAGTPESLTSRAPNWRSAAAILGITAILVIGAATAAYAALSKGTPKARPVVTTVAQVVPPTTPTTTVPTTQTTPTPTPTTPGVTATTPTPTSPGSPTAVNPLLPTGTTTPPKIPLTAPTPKSSGTGIAPTKATAPSVTEPSPSASTPKTSKGSAPSAEPQPSAILLDTNAASTYNPYNYPASSFGDPSLAIDGEAATGWTAQVEPTVAPKMAEGLAIDLKTPHRLSSLALLTTTPGMTVQVYGANGAALPTSITDPAWVQLSPYFLEKKKHVRIKLRHPAKAFRFVALWISGAPAASVGTPQAPGHVSVNELELFPTHP